LTLLAGLAMVSCSTESDAEPTTVPTVGMMVPTISPGGTSVGSILDEINTAWASVRAVRTVFWTAAVGDISDTTPTTGEVTIELAIAPDQRQVIRMVDNVVIEEQVSVGGRIFMKGPIVVAAIAPMVGTDTWVEVDPQGAETTSAVAAQLTWLLSPVESPFGTVSQETRGLEAFPGEAIRIDGRTCNTWQFGSADGIQQELAVDDQGLPCRLIQRAGEFANITLYEVNPDNAAIVTPAVASPIAP